MFSTHTMFISCRNTVLFFAYIKILNFREAAICRQKTYTSARIFFRCCYLMPATFFDKRTNRTQCLLLSTNMSDRNRMPPFCNLKNCQSRGKLTSYYAKFGFCGEICAFCISAWQLCGCLFCLFGKWNDNCLNYICLIISLFWSRRSEVGTRRY